MNIDLKELIPRVHAAAKLDGWWDTPRNAGEALMLCVSDLSKALEADRNGRHADLVAYAEMVNRSPPPATKTRFEYFIKNSVGDELADTYIRLCDFACGFGLDVAIVAEGVEQDRHVTRSPSPYQNFGCDLLDATRRVVAIADADFAGRGSVEVGMRRALTELECLCAQHGIDLAAHIDLKLAYNATRGQRRNKAY